MTSVYYKIKKCFSLFVFSCIPVISTLGQNTMTFQKNAYLIGDQHGYVMIKNTKSVSEGSSGSNVFWDFSYLEAGDSLTSYLLDATEQEGNEYFPESNIVIHEDGRNYFFKVNQTGMEEYGYVVGNNILKYEKPIQRFSYPFIYGETLEGTFYGKKIGSEGNVVAGNYYSKIDGFGTLFLPGNVEYKNVLRVRTSKIKENSNVEEVSYRWYLQNTDPVLRYPLLSIAKIETSTTSWVRIAGYHIRQMTLAEKEGTVNELFTENSSLKGTRDHFVYFVTTFIDGNIVNSKKLIHVKK